MTNVNDMLEVAVKAADGKRAEDLVSLDIHEMSIITDNYLILSAPTERQVIAIADEIIDQMAEAGFELIRQEGRSEGQWALLDFGDLIVHVFKTETRDFYRLEKNWQAAPEVAIDQWIIKEDF
ncbi:ribosome silencing factor [Weissella hellenica]|uniref:Ribosomal silencing factor RsfS n=1 Tax=Weissella hellenica TaxID=46256 RepID=A0A4Y4G1U4_WEIHE|nr:ribosome silencing factor [Weissella hellenica]NKY66838.1 ribosome silencing factor [Weissella hellenica]GED35767.1 ribosomal silencing factor RsfS [Weissella hellenica]SCB89459.1 ribosome-associated protein [Weissella hellenica]